MNTLIVYHTRTGHTLEAVEAIAAGIKAAGGKTKVVQAKEFDSSLLSDYKSFIVASPCWAGSSGVKGVAKPLVSLLKKLPDNSLKGKKIGGVAVHAKYGGDTTLQHMEKLMAKKGGEDFKAAPVAKAGVLMSLYKGPSVKENDEEKLKDFGKAFASNGR